jgi:hypothetical protein
MSLLGFMVGKIRCPQCGAYERHPRDAVREREISESIRNRAAIGIDLGSRKPLPRAFVCAGCEHRFDLDEALDWAQVAKRIGDVAARSGYVEMIRKNRRE